MVVQIKCFPVSTLWFHTHRNGSGVKKRDVPRDVYFMCKCTLKRIQGFKEIQDHKSTSERKKHIEVNRAYVPECDKRLSSAGFHTISNIKGTHKSVLKEESRK